MSIYEDNILDLIEVLENQPSLLTPDDSLSLEEFLKTSPDDIKEFSIKITHWYNQSPTIKNAISEVSKKYSLERNPRKRKLKDLDEAKELIQNVIRQSKECSESFQPSDSQPQQ